MYEIKIKNKKVQYNKAVFKFIPSNTLENQTLHIEKWNELNGDKSHSLYCTVLQSDLT